MYCNLIEEMVVLVFNDLKELPSPCEEYSPRINQISGRYFMLHMCTLCDPQVFVPNTLSQ